jgi:hypothetical protein
VWRFAACLRSQLSTAAWISPKPLVLSLLAAVVLSEWPPADGWEHHTLARACLDKDLGLGLGPRAWRRGTRSVVSKCHEGLRIWLLRGVRDGAVEGPPEGGGTGGARSNEDETSITIMTFLAALCSLCPLYWHY